MNLTVYLPDDLAQEVRDADLPVSSICQAALRQALHGTTDPLERIAADLARIREALGIAAVDQPPARQDEVEVATAILLAAAARRECLIYREFSSASACGIAASWSTGGRHGWRSCCARSANAASLTARACSAPWWLAAPTGFPAKGSSTWRLDTGAWAIAVRSGSTSATGCSRKARRRRRSDLRRGELQTRGVRHPWPRRSRTTSKREGGMNRTAFVLSRTMSWALCALERASGDVQCVYVTWHSSGPGAGDIMGYGSAQRSVPPLRRNFAACLPGGQLRPYQQESARLLIRTGATRGRIRR